MDQLIYLFFQRWNPLPINPFAMKPQIVLRKLQLLSGIPEEDCKPRVFMSFSNNPLPPPIVIIRIYLFADLEGSRALSRRRRPQLHHIHGLSQRTGSRFVNHYGFVLDEYQGFVFLLFRRLDHRPRKPGAGEAIFIAANLDHRSLLEIVHWRIWGQGFLRSKFELKITIWGMNGNWRE